MMFTSGTLGKEMCKFPFSLLEQAELDRCRGGLNPGPRRGHMAPARPAVRPAPLYLDGCLWETGDTGLHCCPLSGRTPRQPKLIVRRRLLDCGLQSLSNGGDGGSDVTVIGEYVA